MRRRDIKIYALAKQGDQDALCELGYRYLLGADGFSKHIDLGLKYLLHPSLINSEQSAKIIAEAIPLGELVRRDLMSVLTLAAHRGSAVAGLKLGFWYALTRQEEDAARRLWNQASENGSEHASSALSALASDQKNPLRAAISSLAALPEVDASRAMAQAVSFAITHCDYQLAVRALGFVVSIPVEQTPEICDAVCDALAVAQTHCISAPRMDGDRLQSMLEDCVKRGNAVAAMILGQALCGIDAGSGCAPNLTTKRNVRGGTALLFRAADAGLSDAWFSLYQLHMHGRGPVANPQAARFFLEKAAASGDPRAQRQLGVSILKSARDINDIESGMTWMTQAATQEDAIAKRLLRRFVQPVRGEEHEAHEAIAKVARCDPGIAHRLRIARNFGLTKTEALCVDVASGVRPWGFVVSKEAADRRLHSKLSRAIPALDAKFVDHLREAADFLRPTSQSTSLTRAKRRQRERRLEHVLAVCGCDDELFFAQAPIARLRQGKIWTRDVNEMLRAAVAV